MGDTPMKPLSEETWNGVAEATMRDTNKTHCACEFDPNMSGAHQVATHECGYHTHMRHEAELVPKTLDDLMRTSFRFGELERFLAAAKDENARLREALDQAIEWMTGGDDDQMARILRAALEGKR